MCQQTISLDSKSCSLHLFEADLAHKTPKLEVNRLSSNFLQNMLIGSKINIKRGFRQDNQHASGVGSLADTRTRLHTQMHIHEEWFLHCRKKNLKIVRSRFSVHFQK